MNKNTIIISIVSVLAIFGFLGLVYFATNKPAQPQVYAQVNTLAPDDHITWSKAKKNLLVEYSDLQCPACRAYHDVIKEQIESDKSITDKITLVYRHFPLTSLHVFAKDAAYSAEAAGKQGKFFEMANLMFDTQDEWENSKNSHDVQEYFFGLAKELKLNLDTYQADVKSDAVKQRVQRDIDSGNAVNVQATPTFFLNGEKLDNIRSFDDFKKLLQNTK